MLKQIVNAQTLYEKYKDATAKNYKDRTRSRESSIGNLEGGSRLESLKSNRDLDNFFS